MVEQVVWVSTDDGHEACYDAFDAKALSSAVTAVVVALAVVGLTFGEFGRMVNERHLLSRRRRWC